MRAIILASAVLTSGAVAAEPSSSIGDAILGMGFLTLALAFLPTLIAGFGARRIAPEIGVFALNVLSVLSAFPFFILGVILWFAALFLAISATNETRRMKEQAELIRTLKAQAGVSSVHPERTSWKETAKFWLKD